MTKCDLPDRPRRGEQESVRLAVPGRPVYRVGVKFLRALALVCFGFGLFVQVAANAAAVPQAELARMGDCSHAGQEMSGHGMNSMEGSSDHKGSCPDMTLECLIAMNCLPPLALLDTGPAQPAPLPAARIYGLASAAPLEGELARPESPPPQAYLTV